MARKHNRFEPDRQLVGRMMVTMFLLGLLYVAFAAVLLVILKSWIIVVVIAAAVLAAQYWYSDRIALFAMKAQPVTAEEQPELHAIVDRLCALADMSKPQVAVAKTNLPNAFATGRNADHTVICVTTGMLGRLDEDELEGVLAHELSHVAHRDVAVITVAAFLGVLAGLLVRFTFYSALFGGGRRANNNPAVFGVIMAVLSVSAAVYSISFLLIRALSRYRELAADRSAAHLTGRPSALASALVKLDSASVRIPVKDLRTAQAFNAFFFTPATTRGSSAAGRLLSTHPSTEQRLEQLAQISARLGESS
ncbi:MAG TPA: zinc metalloprotease HtpX [Actinocrinis sp.]|nr:zinc metalloprotease HtpX [Actinocrinis sp.]